MEAIRKTPEIWQQLDEGVIRLEMEAECKEEIFTELVEALIEKGLVPPDLPVLEEGLRREAVLSTGVGNGVALPHARLQAFGGHALAFGRPKEPVDVGAVDGDPADLFFLLIADRNDPGMIVRILGRLARLCDDETVRIGLRKVTVAEDVIELFRSHESGRTVSAGGT